MAGGKATVRIGIVDDDATDRSQLHAAIDRFGAESGVALSVTEFSSAGAYLSAPGSVFDILYLDIDMPGMSGMELAETIRQTDSGVVIIFCTNLQQFAVNGYRVSALGFIVKPVEWYPFQLFLTRALRAVGLRAAMRSKTAAKRIVLKDGGVSRVVDVADIEYVEVRKHYLLYYVRPGDSGSGAVLRVRGTMRAAEAELSPHGFSRCSASYLVNLSHVTSVDRNDVHVDEQTLSIGRTFRDQFRQDFSRYLANRGWEAPLPC